MRITASKVSYRIPALTDAAAAQRVESALWGVRGVRRVAADPARRALDVVYAPGTVSRDDLGRALRKAGFDRFSIL